MFTLTDSIVFHRIVFKSCNIFEMRVNVLLLLLSSWLIADSQRLFNYYDYFLNKVSVSPALIVDKN